MTEANPNAVCASGPREFGVTQVFKFIEGDTETVFPIYDLNKFRKYQMTMVEVPPEIHEQIRVNIRDVKERLQSNPTIYRTKPIAIVGYGPSLEEYWPELKKYDTIISVSGAHKFLIDRDIIPTYHVDVDFRERKAVHTKEPHSDVIYLLGSIVHPKLIDNVRHLRHKLWHIEIMNAEYPKGEIVFPGYWDVGQQAILVARELGFRTMHLFGFDYSCSADTGKAHAGFHNGNAPTRVMAKIGERYYPSFDNLVRGAITFTKLMEDNPDLKIIIHSEGLLSAYLTEYYNECNMKVAA